MNPMGDYPAAPAASIEQTVTPQPQTTSQPAAVVVVEGLSEGTKPIAFQPGKVIGARKRPSERTLN
jgi:hypothetical protein